MHKKILLSVVVIIIASKLLLTGKGFLSWADEVRYVKSILAVSSLLSGHYRTSLLYIFTTSARPGDGFFKIIPAAFQLLIQKFWGTKYYEPQSYIVIFIYNFLINIFIVLLHFKISRQFLKSTLWSLISVICLLSMMSFTVYLRHALPYDAALLILYGAVYLLFKRHLYGSVSNFNGLVLGMAAFGAFTVYPGYYPFIAILGLILITPDLADKKIIRVLQLGVFYALGMLLILLLFQFLSRLGWHSYIKDCQELSETITLGDFDNSYLFPIQYLIRGEGLVGYLVLGLTALSFITAIVYLKTAVNNKAGQLLYAVFGGAILCLLGYATLGVVFKKMVFYARQLHMYFPLLIFSGMVFLKMLCDYLKVKELVVIYSIAVICLAGYFINFINYRLVVYGRDVVYNIEKEYKYQHPKQVYEFGNIWVWSTDPSLNAALNTYDPRGVPLIDSSQTISSTDSIVIVNGCTFFPVRGKIETGDKLKPLSNYKLVFSKPSTLNFKAYQYEGFDNKARQILETTYVPVKVYIKL